MPRIADLLSGRKPLTLPAAATAMEAARAMAENQIGAMLVTAADGSLAGIFTERDLMTRVVARGLDPGATRLADVMTRELFTARPDDRLADLRREVQSRHIRHLPVVEDGSVIGVLSLRDILRADLVQKTLEVESITKYIRRDDLGIA
jgi:CBS domain-containing protein